MEALKKSLPHGRHGPRLERQIANKSISYDSSGSNRRRRSRHGDGDADGEADSSSHSHDEWSVDEFSVHGRDGVEEMNYMFRYLGLPGPASLGITRDAWEAVKQSPTGGLGEETATSPVLVENNGFTFMPTSSRRSFSSPGEAGRRSLFDFEDPTVSPQRPPQRSLSLDPANARVNTENASPQRSPAAEVPAQPPHDNEAKVTRVPTHDFTSVVKKAVAQAQRIQADAAAVSSFIDQHRDVEDLSRTESSPDRLEWSQYEPPRSDDSGGVTGISMGNQIARALSEPVNIASLRAGDETSSFGQKDIGIASIKGHGLSLSAPQPNYPDTSISGQHSRIDPGPRVADSGNSPDFSQRSVAGVSREKAVAGTDTSHNVTTSLVAQTRPSLKRPPPMNILRLQPEEFSTHEMLGSLAPDSPAVRQILSRTDVLSSASDEELPARDEANVANGGEDPVDPAGGQRPRNLTVEVPQLEPLGIDVALIGQNPEAKLPEVVQLSGEPVGPRFPWTKGDMLGAGSFGTVYEAVDSDGMWFAVKEVSLVEQDKQAQQCISQLMQEVELLSQFKHENIVQYLGTQRADGKLYIFLELVSKGALASVCKRIKLTHSQISAYTRQILKGLKYLHDQNIVHRDIKCANILVDIRGTCKLADFGMAKQIGSLDQAKSTKGSAYWMAPEVIDPKKTYGNPADIWSLGCSIIEMATGSPPFGDMEWYRVLWTVGHGTAPPLPDCLSESAKDFVRRCLEVNPKKRPTASELLQHPFVKQAGGTTPTSSGQLSAAIVLQSLGTITEENSADFANSRASLSTGVQANEILPNGHPNTTSS